MIIVLRPGTYLRFDSVRTGETLLEARLNGALIVYGNATRKRYRFGLDGDVVKIDGTLWDRRGPCVSFGEDALRFHQRSRSIAVCCRKATTARGRGTTIEDRRWKRARCSSLRQEGVLPSVNTPEKTLTQASIHRLLKARDDGEVEEELVVRNKVTAFAAATSLIAALFAAGGVALAHPVGDASEPNCHGQRVSHGASHSQVHEGHELTPVERRDLVEEFTGPITIGEWNKFIKTCPPPEQPPI